MDVRPGYKQTEIGPISEDWEVVSASDVGVFRGGNGFPVVHQGASFGEYPFFKVSDMNLEGNAERMVNSNNWISEETRKHIGVTAFPANAIVFAKVGAAVFLERKKILVQPSCIDNNMAAYVIDDTKADYRFIHLLLLTIKLGELVATTALPALNSRQLGEMKLPLPPKAEQRAIVDAMTDMDTSITAISWLLNKKRDLRTGVMQRLLTGETRLAGFSTPWQKKRLGDLGVFLKGAGVKRDDALSGHLPCVRYGEIYTTHHNVIRDFSSYISRTVADGAKRIQFGDLLFAGSGETKAEIGKCVALAQDVEAYAGGDIIILRPKSGNPVFLGWLLNTPQVVRQKANFGQGDAVVHISASALASIEVSLPDLDEQDAIAKVITDMDAEITALETRLKKTRALKQGMMQALLTGRVRLPARSEAFDALEVAHA